MIKWFDERTGEAEVVRGGRVFRAQVREIESAARHPGARVHFDIERTGDVEVAVNVTARIGMRTSRRQHNFGALTDGRSIGSKGATPHPTADGEPTAEREPGAAGALPIEGLASTLQVSVLAHGDVDEETKLDATRAVVRVVEELGEPTLFARLKLHFDRDPARLRPAQAEVAVDVDGELVRAHVADRTMPEAIDLLEHRLRDRLSHRAQHREELREHGAAARPGMWQHSSIPTERPTFFDRPPTEREVVRRKTFATEELLPDEAIFDMEQLDFDFYLFCDLASGSDSLVERVGDGSYEMTRLQPTEVDSGPTAATLRISGVPAPQLQLSDAIERLDSGGEPHVFFADAATGRGNVLYRRYDGNYGLLTPD
jgi:ribosome-associated translation inhibitor RaiA